MPPSREPSRRRRPQRPWLALVSCEGTLRRWPRRMPPHPPPVHTWGPRVCLRAAHGAFCGGVSLMWRASTEGASFCDVGHALTSVPALRPLCMPPSVRPYVPRHDCRHDAFSPIESSSLCTGVIVSKCPGVSLLGGGPVLTGASLPCATLDLSRRWLSHRGLPCRVRARVHM